jgi:hypothetical protein
MTELLDKLQLDMISALICAAIFALLLLWILFRASKSQAHARFFDGPDESQSMLRFLGFYIAIFDGVFRAYIAIVTRTMPDIPYVSALLLFGLLGLAKVPEIIAAWRGQPLPPLGRPPEGPQP